MIGGSLKIYWSYGWFCIRFHFSIHASFIVDSEGWYCVTNGNISFSSLLFCFRSLESLLWILFLIVGFLSKFVGSLCPSNNVFIFLEIWIIFLKVVSEEFFRRVLNSFDKSFFNTWRWHKVKCVCKKVSHGFHLFQMCLCIKDRFFPSLCLCEQPCLKTQSQCQMFRPWIWIVRWCPVSGLFNEGFDVWCTHVP